MRQGNEAVKRKACAVHRQAVAVYRTVQDPHLRASSKRRRHLESYTVQERWEGCGVQIVIPLAPITKKNSQRIIYAKGRPMIIPSKQYKDYEKACEKLNLSLAEPIQSRCNVKCVYYMPTRRRVDLTNLMEATHDILVHCGVLADDNSKIIVSVDGSRVEYDKNNPRTEIEITEVV